ncbi:MAG TPA: hypothetical protein VJ729_10500 [Nitrososphaeraceae archaeon]|jgi:hypothetical protein|nr:hypothetical protein [Nitrososphaeraceae archaeon]
MSNLGIILRGYNQYLVDFWVAEEVINNKVVVVAAVSEICLASKKDAVVIVPNFY